MGKKIEKMALSEPERIIKGERGKEGEEQIERDFRLTHLNQKGNPRMVNVGSKGITFRKGIASGEIWMKPETKEAILKNRLKKGGVIQTAIVAGILGGKRTWELIPMCHPIPIEGLDVEIEPTTRGFKVTATATTTGKTGIEMEVLTAVSIALLTIYDMAKSIDRGMEITNIRLEYKSGGKSGVYCRQGDN